MLSRLSISPNSFRAFTRGKILVHNGRAGARISYHDSLAARTTFGVYRHQAKPKCSKKAGRCSQLTFAGRFTHADVAGANAFRFEGRVQGRALSPGNYQLRLTAELGGESSCSITTQFRILSP